ncbi:hypothetical protein STRIP9103_05707, partial [Streptomyces ipomoeae 91-03]
MRGWVGAVPVCQPV